MNILHITAQKPSSTGSGVYLTQLARAIEGLSVSRRQGVLAGAYAEDVAELEAGLPDGIRLYPVIFGSESLPFNIFGMSDVMPYRSSLYSTMTAEQQAVFLRKLAHEYTLMGKECEREGMTAAAIANYKKALQLCPEAKEPQRRLKKLEKDTKKT